jgi:aryl-alcohol dehydrogenase-like predicted oxidoreductase
MGGVGYGRADIRLSRKSIRLALEKGIRHFDTAGFYAKGQSERLLMAELSPVRKEVFISTKGGLVWEGNRVFHRARPEELKEQLLASLDRLGTDYVDLFQLHWPDPDVPIKESISALEDMKRSGLIRFWGAGNLKARQILEHFRPGSLVPLQTPFNPCRMASQDILKAGHHGSRTINCIVSPFEQGLLTDPKFIGRPPGKKDIRRKNPLFLCQNLKRPLGQFFHWILDHDISAAAFLLLWLLCLREVDIVIPGPRTPGQVEEVFQHVKWLDGTGLLERDLHDILEEEFGHDIFILLDELGEESALCPGTRYPSK